MLPEYKARGHKNPEIAATLPCEFVMKMNKLKFQRVPYLLSFFRRFSLTYFLQNYLKTHNCREISKILK